MDEFNTMPTFEEQTDRKDVINDVEQIAGKMPEKSATLPPNSSETAAGTATAARKAPVRNQPPEHELEVKKPNTIASKADQETCLRGIAASNKDLLFKFVAAQLRDAPSQEKFLGVLAKQDREVFVSTVTDWVKEEATPEEARRVEISGKFRREVAKQDEIHISDGSLSPAKSIRVVRGKYIEEQWREDGRRHLRHLGKILPEENKIILKYYDDFSQHYVSPSIREQLADMTIEKC